MARSRMIKPEFSDDEQLAAACSRDARLLYVLSWCQCDDYGVLKAHPGWLKNHIFPYDDDITMETFKGWLKEIENFERYIPFEAKGERYYYLPKFPVHQRIKNPSIERRNPPVPQELIDLYSSPTEALPQEGGSPTEGGETENKVSRKRNKVERENNAHAREEEPKDGTNVPVEKTNGKKTEGQRKADAIREIKALRQERGSPVLIGGLMEKYGLTEADLEREQPP